MNPTWVMSFPDGYETGTFLALDMGGTNLRVCEITLTDRKSEFDIIQSKYRMPEELKTGSSEELWEYIAACLQQFVETHHGDLTKIDALPLGFTFSYPATQNYIDEGILQRWTKGFDIAGVEGENVVPMFEAAIAKRVSDACSGLTRKEKKSCWLTKHTIGSTHQTISLNQRHHRNTDCFRIHRHQDENWLHLRNRLQCRLHGGLWFHS
jgi:hypothetical protein